VSFDDHEIACSLEGLEHLLERAFRRERPELADYWMRWNVLFQRVSSKK